jgi:hypothetical protein
LMAVVINLRDIDEFDDRIHSFDLCQSLDRPAQE